MPSQGSLKGSVSLAAFGPNHLWWFNLPAKFLNCSIAYSPNFELCNLLVTSHLCLWTHMPGISLWLCLNTFIGLYGSHYIQQIFPCTMVLTRYLRYKEEQNWVILDLPRHALFKVVAISKLSKYNDEQDIGCKYSIIEFWVVFL